MTTPILVTGGTGTLGRPVAQRLREAGASVTVLSRHPREAAEAIRYTAGDLSTGEGIEAAVRGAEVIVHCAGSSKGDEQKTRTLVSAAKDVRHIVLISVVGAGRRLPPASHPRRAGNPAVGHRPRQQPLRGHHRGPGVSKLSVVPDVHRHSARCPVCPGDGLLSGGTSPN
jgi:nucleoside-diphosphate-sugar epimerase